ncbi:MAG TPA: oligosaccharide flippase family protein [Candidatus Krumholzibacteria bacterium]|nr:oligosaccharide flippase family protein [Candidatus Krumholzibacteria bacterium]
MGARARPGTRPGRRPHAGGRGVWSDAGALIGGQLLAQLANLAALAWTARLLGAADFGLLQIAVAAVSYLLVGAELGLFTHGVREVSRLDDAEAARAAVRGHGGLLLLLAGAGLLLGLPLLTLLPAHAHDPAVFRLYLLALLPQAFMLDWVALARGLPWIAGVGRAARSLVYAALVVTLAGGLDGAAGQPLRRWIPLLYLISLIAGDALVWRLVRARVGGPLAPRWPGTDAARALLRGAAPIGGAHLGRRLLFNVDLLLLGVWALPADAGRYAAAAKLAFPLVVGAEVVLGALLPRLARAWADGPAAYAASLRRLLGGAALLWAAGAAAGAAAGPWLLPRLFGAGFADAAGLARWLFPAYGLLGVGVLLHEAQIAADRARGALIPLAAAAAAALLLGRLWIPTQGADGAARAVILAHGLYAAGGLARCLLLLRGGR